MLLFIDLIDKILSSFLFLNINLYFGKSNIDYKIVNILLNYNKKVLKVEKEEKTENDYFVFNFPNNETFID